MSVRTLACAIAVVALVAGAPSPALGQGDYPNKPIKILVPFPPAQISDIVARAIGDGLREALGQPVIIENKPGQAGSIGVAEFARAAPDGYTLLLGATAAFASNKFLYKNVPYDPLKDFQPITMISTTRLLLMVGEKVPAKNMAELLKIMKEQPGKLSYASSGYGTISHMTMEAFKLSTGGGATHVPFPGIAQSTTAMLGGDIDVMIDAVFSVNQHIKSGKIRPIAVPMPARDPLLPDVPTFAELGLVGFGHTSWTAMFVPVGTPKPIVDRLNAAIVKIVQAPEFQRRFEGLNIVTSTPDAAQKWIADDYYYWGDIVKRASIKVE
jgi:tripartite-type tricarboxylate transporter receptor subunit TctC